MKQQHIHIRASIPDSRRVVVKVGTRVLMQRSGRPDRRRFAQLVDDIAWMRRKGYEVVLVSSGAIGAGMEAMKWKKRPDNLPDQQLAAAVGQSRLMSIYNELFQAQRFRTGQILLTHDNLKNRARHLNARNTMLNLLRHGIIPIVNENDVISVDEIRFGDNDMLASLVALLIDADLLVLLSTTNGLRETLESGRTRRIAYLETITDEAMSHVQGKGSELSTGGMASKLEAAKSAVCSGIAAVIADGRKAGTLQRIIAGEDIGTLFALPKGKARQLSGRKQWIAFFHRASGTLTVDAGAEEAIIKKGRSLLPIGITKVEGNFEVGSLVNIQSKSGTVFARGLVEYSSRDIDLIKRKKTASIASILGRRDYDEVIHRDNMVVLD